ncbi:MAG: hypothetical protein FWD28_00600 [Treponema sp.]|nr:hypothetical protein [Treponema sp.]
MRLITAKKYIFLIACAAILFSSCIGASIDIQMNRNGSGRITLEYKVPKIIEAIGRLDGNESNPIIPVSRQDFERTASRISGLRLVSYSSRERGGDIVTSAVLEYDNPQTLFAFLGSSSEGSSDGKIVIRFNGQNESRLAYNENMPDLPKSIFTDYLFSVSFNGHSPSVMTLIKEDGGAASVPPHSQAVMSGNKVSFSIPILELLDNREISGLTITW